MSTRAIYTFHDDDDAYHVYKHHDGYPWPAAVGGFAHIRAALTLAWPLPRFEPDEFAAAFVAMSKMGEMQPIIEKVIQKGSTLGVFDDPVRMSVKVPQVSRFLLGGGVRLLKSGDWKDIAPWDIAYRYTITNDGDDLHVACYGVDSGRSPKKLRWTEGKLFEGTLTEAMAWATEQEAKSKAEVA